METFEKENHWRFYLRDNSLTKDNTKDCIAEVLAAPKTLRAEDIAKEIKRRGSELEYETILSVISQHNRIIIENLLSGASVMTDICQFSPRITGVFASKEAQFDATIHKLVLDIVLSKNMRESLKRVKTINMGMKPDVARIGLVTDASTGLFDGSITPNEDILIDGSKIKIVGEEGEEAVGAMTPHSLSVAAAVAVAKMTDRSSSNLFSVSMPYSGRYKVLIPPAKRC